MTIRTPVVSVNTLHNTLAGGDAVAGTALQRSTDAGNQLLLGSDGGLLVPPAGAATVVYGNTTVTYTKAAWQAEGSPATKLFAVKVNLSQSVPAECLLVGTLGMAETVLGKDSPRGEGMDISQVQMLDAGGAAISRRALVFEMYPRINLPPMTQYVAGSNMPYTFGGMAPRFILHSAHDGSATGKKIASVSMAINTGVITLTSTGDAINSGNYVFAVYLTLLGLP